MDRLNNIECIAVGALMAMWNIRQCIDVRALMDK